MNYEKCGYCEKDLDDPEAIVVGTFRMKAPRMYHLDCYERMKFDSTVKKLPRSIWTRENIPEALRIALSRLITFGLLFIVLFLGLIYGIRLTDGGPILDLVFHITYLLIVLLIMLVLWIKFRRYLGIRDHFNKYTEDEKEYRKYFG